MAGFFKHRGHYVFDYKPIFYDPRREDREKRLNNIKKEMGLEDDENKKSNASFDFRRTSISRARKDKSSSVRLIVILIFLSIFAYIFLYTDLIEKFTSLLTQ